MEKCYSLQETLDYILDSRDNEGLADTETEDSEPEDHNLTSETEEAKELEEENWESDVEGYEEKGHTDQIYIVVVVIAFKFTECSKC